MMREKRDGGGTNEQICNMDLVDWFERSLADDYKQMVQKYSDLSNVNLYLGDGKNNQALGVLSEAIVMIKDSFFGVFGEAGDFQYVSSCAKKEGERFSSNMIWRLVKRYRRYTVSCLTLHLKRHSADRKKRTRKCIRYN